MSTGGGSPAKTDVGGAIPSGLATNTNLGGSLGNGIGVVLPTLGASK